MATQATTGVTADAASVTISRRRTRLTVPGAIGDVVLLAVQAAIRLPRLHATPGGFKTNGQLAANPVAILPDPWVFTNYTDVLIGENAATFWQQLLNSVVIATIAVGVTVTCASLAAFVFARLGFPGREAMYTLFVFGLLFPSAVAILPLYILVRDPGPSGHPLWGALPERACGLGRSANPRGVALPQAAFGLPLSIVILRPFFRSIPAELEDAARIDGCGSFGVFLRGALPPPPAAPVGGAA